MSRSLLFAALLSSLLGPWSIARAEETSEDRPPKSVSWRYDAVGRLVRNHQGQGKDSPPYVLLDKTGKPRCYITPGEGVDVRSLVNARVGVRGSVKAIAGDPLPHIVARGVRPVADPASTAAKPPDNMAGGQVELAAATEELVSPTAEPRNTMTSAPEEIDGGTIVEGGAGGGAMAGPNVGPQFHDEPGSFGQGDDLGHGDCEEGRCDHDCCPARPCGACIECCRANDPGMWWVRAEYLAWATKGMYIPALVTTGPNAQNPGILGEPGTEILFGDQTINNEIRSGGRISFGNWLDCSQTWGVGGEYFALEDERTNFFAESDANGVPTISRPFFTVFGFNADGTPKPAGENAELVALDDVIAGSVEVETSTAFQGAGGYLRYNICCKNMCWPACCCCDPCNASRGTPGGLRVGLIGGYRFYKLRDSVSITEDLRSLLTEEPGEFLINDRFSTSNKFDGAEIGFVVDARRACWTAELMGRIAIGGNKQRVRINGSTVITNSLADDGEYVGGLLALPTNIGNYNRSTFAVIPQLNANLGYNITRRLKVVCGYTLIYWSSVVRAGDQISLDVNETFIPRAFDMPEGPERPAFAWRNSDFWAHGVNVGLDFRF